MIIDLDSWDAGYYDALLGRPSQCTASLDRVSYSSGYSQAHAYGAQVRGGPSPALPPATARRQPSANRHLKYQRSCFGEVIAACGWRGRGRARWIHRREVTSLIGRRRDQCFLGQAASSRHVVINILEAGSQSDS